MYIFAIDETRRESFQLEFACADICVYCGDMPMRQVTVCSAKHHSIVCMFKKNR